jgi:hypothetical protein
VIGERPSIGSGGCGGVRPPAFLLVHVLIEPLHEKLGDASTVPFGHHLVAITGQPDVFESHAIGLDSGLVEPFGYAVRVHSMIAPLSRHLEDRNAHKVHKLVRRLRLNSAPQQGRTIRMLIFSRAIVVPENRLRSAHLQPGGCRGSSLRLVILPQCTFLSSHSIMNLDMPALFFSAIIWWPLPGSPTSSSFTKSVLTPACWSHLAVQWEYGR